MKKTKFKKKELTVFSSMIKNRLKEEKSQLKSTTKMLKDHKSYQASDKADNDHDASTLRNKEMLRNMKRRAERKVNRLDEALVRIKNKTYGRCQRTGKMISKDRLMVLPEARLSMSAKKM